MHKVEPKVMNSIIRAQSLLILAIDLHHSLLLAVTVLNTYDPMLV